MTVPKHYQYLLNGDNPRVILEAMKFYGLREVKGKAHNPIILDWAKEIGGAVEGFYKEDETPWCGLFMAVVLKRAGFTPPQGFNALRALEYATWGNPSALASLGDIVVLKRAGGGHVGLYVGHDSKHFHILGGNQGDAVNVQKFPFGSGLIQSVRRCIWKIRQPDSVRPVFLPDNLGIVSKRQD